MDHEADDGDDEEALSAASRLALAKVLESCHDKAAALNAVLQAVMPAAGASRMRRYVKALKTIPNADKVENLMGGILGDLQVLTGNHAVKAAVRAQMGRLVEAETTGKSLDGAISPAVVTLHNLGLGSQFVHTGQGHQNVAGGGIQINGTTSGPLYLNGSK
ncbi:hypothetical protein XA68_17989 [Ophiocordyceps unilateralis]|uniref:NACHT-NTPase and P-loop NTPases N-terminal domain-containing protein n=1 Tax=Ophiocordyceps unilateralis TaxID=268505 RepID=A0A2A9P3W9_OPHUN|nr:hypothetical protein XA68_17989 [Ophiocordyceps unilateralis]